MISLGVDLSLTATGIIRLDNGKITDRQLIKTKPSSTVTGELKRIMEIKHSIVIKDADLVVIEGLAFMARNTSALIQLSALNYMFRERLFLSGIPFVIVPPTQLKKFVSGKGNAPKELVMLDVYKRYGISFKDNNEADAYVLSRIGEGLLDNNVKLTSTQREVIDILKEQYENNK